MSKPAEGGEAFVIDSVFRDRLRNMLPLATLQRRQRVSPISNISELRGSTEDGDDFEPFMEAVTSARRSDK